MLKKLLSKEELEKTQNTRNVYRNFAVNQQVVHGVRELIRGADLLQTEFTRFRKLRIQLGVFWHSCQQVLISWLFWRAKHSKKLSFSFFIH